MKLSNETRWNEFVTVNSDPYGAACVRYAKAWAELMEEQLTKGSTLQDCVKHTSHTADTEGITGFMYGCAVQMLSTCWEHGEELRRWHNLDTQLGTEGERANETGGVLNPAIVNVEV